MKIIVCSDIHGNKYAFDSFFNDIKKLSYDKIIFCGDVFGYYYYAEEIVHELKNGFHCLLGNHDKMLIDAWDGLYSTQKLNALIEKYGSVYKTFYKRISEETINFLRSLDSSYVTELDGLKLGFFHGTPDDPLNGRLYPDTQITDTNIYNKYDYVFLGHTHHKTVRNINNTIVINPGSLGQQRDGKGCSYLIFDTSSEKYEFKTISYDREKLLRDIQKYDNGMIKLSEVLYR